MNILNESLRGEEIRVFSGRQGSVLNQWVDGWSLKHSNLDWLRSEFVSFGFPETSRLKWEQQTELGKYWDYMTNKHTHVVSQYLYDMTNQL